MPRQKSTHVDSPAAVGERLKLAREKAGLSQRQLSFPGCSPAYISRIESGDRIPSLQLLRELGRRLSVSEDYLATGSDVRGDRGGVLVEDEVALRLNELDEAERLYSSLLEGTPPALRAAWYDCEPNFMLLRPRFRGPLARAAGESNRAGHGAGRTDGSGSRRRLRSLPFYAPGLKLRLHRSRHAKARRRAG